MEAVEGIPRAYVHRACSYKEKPEEKDLSTKSGISDDAASPASSVNGCFDCNICLDFVVDPVVTLCGHLYCWPCIYKWMQVESMSPRQCPVCKASLSQDTLVPLYGRGGQSTAAGSDVPHRPTLHRDHAVIPSVPTQQPPFRRHQRHYFRYTSGGSSSLLFAPLFRSTAGGVLGGLAILPWAQRNHGMNTYYASPDPIALGSNNPRLLRHQMQVESSLHQICVFLFFCALLCLLLF
ncbi:unnamed protein product [Musa textilis]